MQNIKMKYTVFILTFLAYAVNHACRMTLSFNKPNIKMTFGFTPLQLGILDAVVYVAYGLGAFFRFCFFKERQLTKIYLISSIGISIFYSCIPLISIFYNDVLIDNVTQGASLLWFDVLIIISMAGYGFSQLATWQIILTMISRYWAWKEGLEIGFWTSMSCIGNILGFFVCNFMVNSLKFRWQITMLFFSFLNLIAAIILYVLMNKDQRRYIQNIPQTILQQQPNQNQQQRGQILPKQQPITFDQYVHFNAKKIISQYQYRLYILNAIFSKVLNYSFLLWYPLYLYTEGFEDVKGYITLLFQLTSIVGSFLMGKIGSYDKCTCARLQCDPSPNNNWLKAGTVILKTRNCFVLLFSVAMVFLFLMNFGSLKANILITIVLGFTIGGQFHVSSALNTMKMGQQIPRNVDMISNFSTSISTTFLGLFQLIIGFMIHCDIDFYIDLTLQSDSSHKFSEYGNFFFIIIFLMIICAIITFFRSGVLKILCPDKQQQKKIQLKQIKQNQRTQVNQQNIEQNRMKKQQIGYNMITNRF